MDELEVYGYGKRCDLNLRLADGKRFEIPVENVRLITHGAAVQSTPVPWDDIKRIIRVSGPNLKIRRAVVAWPGSEEDLVAELTENVQATFSGEGGELGFVVHAELELERLRQDLDQLKA